MNISTALSCAWAFRSIITIKITRTITDLSKSHGFHKGEAIKLRGYSVYSAEQLITDPAVLIQERTLFLRGIQVSSISSNALHQITSGPGDWRQIKMFLRKPSCQVESAENFQKEFLQGLKIKGIFVWVGKQDQISNKAKRHSNFLKVFPPPFWLKISVLFKPLCFCCTGLTETVLLVLMSSPETKHHTRSK